MKHRSDSFITYAIFKSKWTHVCRFIPGVSCLIHEHSGNQETESSMEATDAVLTVISFYIFYISLSFKLSAR